MFLRHFLIVTAMLFQATAAITANLKPYILANKNSDLNIRSLEDKLRAAGFEILGSFQPANGYSTVCFTHKDLKQEATKADVPMGAVLRASLVDNNGQMELSYCSPHYWAYASGLKGNSADALASKLKEALGMQEEFGSAKGMSEKTLRKYNYAMGMPRLTDLDELKTFSNQNLAKIAVIDGIKATKDVDQVYELDLDSSTRIVGVHIRNNKGSDATVLQVADGNSKGPKLGGLYGPYEIFIQKGMVRAPRGRFRIAVAFPDLSMGTFMKIVAAPGAILDSLKAVAHDDSCVSTA
eukprot:scaffold5865_cov186-Amphora_coffeaeformis.AAC.11